MAAFDPQAFDPGAFDTDGSPPPGNTGTRMIPASRGGKRGGGRRG